MRGGAHQLVDCIRADGVDDVEQKLQSKHDEKKRRHGCRL